MKEMLPALGIYPDGEIDYMLPDVNNTEDNTDNIDDIEDIEDIEDNIEGEILDDNTEEDEEIDRDET